MEVHIHVKMESKQPETEEVRESRTSSQILPFFFFLDSISSLH